jgi:ABC-type nitrate/sulfonate/bicarbonate transport system substrate-binding protein
MLRILILLLVGLVLIGKPGYALDDFVMGVSTKHSSVAYLYMGKERGFFAEEGIELKLVQIPGSLARTALLARQLDGTEFGNEGINLRAGGAPIVNVFAQSEKPGWFFLSSAAIRDLKQISGKTLAVGAVGSNAHLLTLSILKKGGVNPDSVVFMGGRGGSDIRLQMLAGGTVQGANLVPPYNFMAERLGFRELFFYGDYGDLAQFGLVIHESSLEARRPFMKRVLRAFLRSHIYSLQNRDETMKWILANLKVEKPDASKNAEVLIKIATKNGIASDTAIQNALDPAVIKKRKDLVDYSLLREVHQELGMR